MAPEVIQNQKHTVAVDVWALGVILFKMLVGKPAFPGTIQTMIFESIKKKKYLMAKWRKEFDKLKCKGFNWKAFEN